jgi:hypothetical protein
MGAGIAKYMHYNWFLTAYFGAPNAAERRQEYREQSERVFHFLLSQYSQQVQYANAPRTPAPCVQNVTVPFPGFFAAMHLSMNSLLNFLQSPSPALPW